MLRGALWLVHGISRDSEAPSQCQAGLVNCHHVPACPTAFSVIDLQTVGRRKFRHWKKMCTFIAFLPNKKIKLGLLFRMTEKANMFALGKGIWVTLLVPKKSKAV